MPLAAGAAACLGCTGALLSAAVALGAGATVFGIAVGSLAVPALLLGLFGAWLLWGWRSAKREEARDG